jgi:hypothetical protein
MFTRSVALETNSVSSEPDPEDTAEESLPPPRRGYTRTVAIEDIQVITASNESKPVIDSSVEDKTSLVVYEAGSVSQSLASEVTHPPSTSALDPRVEDFAARRRPSSMLVRKKAIVDEVIVQDSNSILFAAYEWFERCFEYYLSYVMAGQWFLQTHSSRVATYVNSLQTEHHDDKQSLPILEHLEVTVKFLQMTVMRRLTCSPYNILFPVTRSNSHPSP